MASLESFPAQLHSSKKTTDIHVLVNASDIIFQYTEERKECISLRTLRQIAHRFDESTAFIDFSFKTFRKMTISVNLDVFNKVQSLLTERLKKTPCELLCMDSDTYKNFLYDAHTELERQGYPSEDFNFWKVVQHNNLELIIPFSFDAEKLDVIKKCRDNFPVYCWGCWDKADPHYGSTLLRCTRPKFLEGETKQSDISDLKYDEILAGQPEEMIEACRVDMLFIQELLETLQEIQATAPNAGSLLPNHIVEVVDTGKRCKTLHNIYPDFSFHFLQIPPTDPSAEKMFSLCTNDNFPENMNTAIENTLWPLLLVQIYNALEKCSHLFRKGASLLIQGMNGDSAVSLVSSAIQLCFDPYFRTIEGFFILLFKEWQSARTSNSKIWSELLLFMHFVSNLLTYNPQYFQFNEDLLTFLMEEIYGTGLDTLKEDRSVFQELRRTSSVLKNTFVEASSDSEDREKKKKIQKKRGGRKKERVHAPTATISMKNLAYLASQRKDSFLNPSYRSDISPARDWYMCGRETPTMWLQFFFYHNTTMKEYTTSFWNLYDGEQFPSNNPTLFWMPSVPPNHVNNTSLILRQSLLRALANNFGVFVRLEKLLLESNMISSLPPSMSCLTNLEVLSLERNKLKSFPPYLSTLQKLTTLNLSHNEIQDVLNICHFTSIETLDISSNAIKSLPSELKRLVKLKELKISQNAIKQIRNNLLLEMTSLHNLQINKLDLVFLPDVDQQQNLHHLNAFGNSIKQIPPSIGKCTFIIILNISSNKLSDLPKEMAQLSCLKRLEASNNKIKQIPSWLHKLTALEVVDFSNNMITDIAFTFFGMEKSLKKVYLRNNAIKNLPISLGNILTTLTAFDVGMNPIDGISKEIVDGGRDPLLKYFQEKMSSSEDVLRMRLMLLGTQKVGKTALVKALLSKWRSDDPLYQEKEKVNYDGISNVYIQLAAPKSSGLLRAKHQNHKLIRLSLYNFTTLRIYHTLHQFFLEGPAIFVLMFSVVDMKTFEEVEFWLKGLKTRGSLPRVVVVGTHMDKYDKNLGTLENRIKEKLKKYGEISLILVNATQEDNNHMTQLRNELESAISNHPNLTLKMPYSYVYFEQLLQDYCLYNKLEIPILTQKHLLHIGSLCNLTDLDSIISCTSYLHQIGSIIYYNKVHALQDLVIVDPQWLVNVMSTIFSQNQSHWLRDGVMDFSTLDLIWQGYPYAVRPKLLVLMEKFEIIYVLNTKEQKLFQIEDNSERTVEPIYSALQNDPPSSDKPNYSVVSYLTSKFVTKLQNYITTDCEVKFIPSIAAKSKTLLLSKPKLSISSPLEMMDDSKKRAAGTQIKLDIHDPLSKIAESENNKLKFATSEPSLEVVKETKVNQASDETSSPISLPPLPTPPSTPKPEERVPFQEPIPIQNSSKIKKSDEKRTNSKGKKRRETKVVKPANTVGVQDMSLALQALQKVPMEEAPPQNLVSQVQNEKENKIILVCSLLSQERPTSLLKKYWPSKEDSPFYHYRRLMQFDVFPIGVFSRIITRLLPATTTIYALWDCGLLATTKNGKAKIFIERWSGDDSQGVDEVFFQVRSTNMHIARVVFTELMDVANQIIDDWGTLNVSHYVPIGTLSFNVVAVSELESHVNNGEEIILLDTRSTYLSELVPDLVMGFYEGPRFSAASINLKKICGQGGFATVYKAKIEARSVAVKQVIDRGETANTKNTSRREFGRELAIQSVLDHNNIVKILGISIDSHLSLVMDYCTYGDLLSLLSNHAREIPGVLRFKIAYEIAIALQYCHSLNPPLAHLDVKSPNVLLCSLDPYSPVVSKLTDFGTSEYFIAPFTTRKVDNPVWLAPEILNSEPYDVKVDTYAFGMVCFELIMREMPFADSGWVAVIQDLILSGGRPQIGDFCLEPFRKQQEPHNRPNWEEIIRVLDQMLGPEIGDEFDVAAAAYNEKSLG
eukprot:TRINITY_DN6356_c0_g1_i12.p1 TRINITY_DN6356_c0_g1~~TRINITY_DN6356_c0_g1_i12.p1  ORF type:complete len:1927 (+),score=345.99 TRINITY_DN6356_c0_g1_i12:34-5814(+)